MPMGREREKRGIVMDRDKEEAGWMRRIIE